MQELNSSRLMRSRASVGSFSPAELSTIREKGPHNDSISPQNEESPLTGLKINKMNILGSNSSLVKMYKASKRGRSMSLQFIHRGEPRSETSKIFLEMISITLPVLYCMLILVLGVAVPIAEVLSNSVPTALNEGFYVYLYILSMLYLLFVYSTLLKQRAVDTVLQSTPDVEKRTTPSPSGRYGSFSLRMGAIAFGIGSMIYSGLEFGRYFELAALPQCSDVLMAVTPIIRIAFIIIQLQFIFVSEKQKTMAKYRTVSKFGLVHMIATNISVWLNTAVLETKHDILSFYNSSTNARKLLDLPIFLWPSRGFSGNRTISDGNGTREVLDAILGRFQSKQEMYECRRANIMGSMVQSAAPFLFPCTIEYSFICSVILYGLWKSVISRSNRKHQTGAYAHKVLKPMSGHTAQHFTVDCANAHKGLFGSIIVLVFTIISLIMFFVLIKEEKFIKAAIFQVNICELTLYALSTIATVLAMHQIRRLKYEKERSVELDIILLVAAQSGLYMYFIFSLIAGYLAQKILAKPYVFFTAACGVLQSTIQTMLIIDAWWRRCTNHKDEKSKPGRQMVTFLLVTNVAMWGINHLENSRSEFHPIELKFYGVWAWSIITQISMPLAVFYRFHSTVCLCEIWKSTYKLRLQQTETIERME